MWSTNRKDRCLRLLLLAANCAACIAIICINLVFISKEQKVQAKASMHELIQPEKLTAESCIPVCNTSACILHASTLLKNIHTTIDQCENFDSFMCGGFKEKYGFEEKGHMSKENISPMLSKIKGILDNLQTEPESASAKMKTVYNSCINYGTSELRGVEDIQNIFNNAGVLNWPFLPEDFSFSQTGLPFFLGNLIGKGAIGFINLLPDPDNVEENSFILHFVKWTFDEETDISNAAAASILKYFDLDPASIDKIINDHKHVREAIISLYEMHNNCEEHCFDNNRIDCNKKEETDWRDVCEATEVVLQMLDSRNQMNTPSLLVKKLQVDFLKNIFSLLDSISHKSVVNFFVLNFINQHQDELNFYFRLSKLKNNQFRDKKEKFLYEVDRWKYCVRWITKNMQIPLANEFIHKFLPSEMAKEMIAYYKDYFSTINEMVAQQEWLSAEIKLDIENRIKNIIINIIALSETFPNDTFVNGLYEKFQPNSESFVDNAMKLQTYRNEIMSFLFFNADTSKLDTILGTNFEVQATSSDSPSNKDIVVHYGMLLPPFYIPGCEKLISRILVGSYIIHEVGHVLDGILALNLENDNTLLEKKQCVRDQFSGFKFEILKEHLNGSFYDIENMPDNLATAVIDKVIANYSANEELALPGLPYTTKQLLYMTFNQFQCSKSNLEEEMKQSEGEYSHALSEFRIIGMMQNSKGFSEAFLCSDESYMNPQRKCLLLETY